MVDVYIDGQKIKKVREALKVSQTELARIAGYSLRTIQRLEKGSDSKSLDKDKLKKIAECLDKEPEFFQFSQDQVEISSHIFKEARPSKKQTKFRTEIIKANERFVIDEYLIKQLNKTINYSIKLDCLVSKKFVLLTIDEILDLIKTNDSTSYLATLREDIEEAIYSDEYNIGLGLGLLENQYWGEKVENVDSIIDSIIDCNHFAAHCDIPENETELEIASAFLSSIEDFCKELALQPVLSSKDLLEFRYYLNEKFQKLLSSEYKFFFIELVSKDVAPWGEYEQLHVFESKWLKLFLVKKSNRNLLLEDQFKHEIILDHKIYREIRRVDEPTEIYEKTKNDTDFDF